MRALRLLGAWWNRHRTGEKTGALLTLAAIGVGVYFGVHKKYEQQTSREAVRRYLSRLTSIVAQLNARGIQSTQVDENALGDSDQDCDSLNAFATATVQPASRLHS